MKETTENALLSGPDEVVDGGLCVTGERHILGLGDNLKLLGWAALVRAFTAGQAARFGWGGDTARAQEALDKLVWRYRWLGRVGPVTLPKGCGPAAKKAVYVYYLTEKGAKVLKDASPQLARHARPGRPTGSKLARLPHELLVAESWLLTSETKEIQEFWPETELKRQIVKNRFKVVGAAGHGGQGGYVPDEATGDFKMRVSDRESRVQYWVEAEVAVRYRDRQIREKPEGMDWYACDPHQAGLIEYVKGVRPYLLGDVTSPGVADCPQPAEAGARGNFRRRVLKALDLMDGAATAPCLQVILDDTYRSHVSQALAHLERSGILSHSDASIQPGQERGRPMKLYRRKAVALPSVYDVLRRACASQMVVEGKKQGFEVVSYDGASGVLTLKSTADSTTIVCVIDYEGRPVAEFSARLEAAAATSRKEGAAVAAVMSHEERIEELAEAFPRESIWDLRGRTRRVRGDDGREYQRYLFRA